MKSSSNVNLHRIRVCSMVCLALYPVLYSYMNSFSMNYGEVFFIVLLPLIFLMAKTYKILRLPSLYWVFWFYVALLLIIDSSEFKVTYLIPGGMAFTLFSLIMGVTSKFLDLRLLYCVMKYIFVVASIILIMQSLGLMPSEFSRCFILPISDHLAYSNTDYEGLMELRQYGTRPSSIFLEPAYFAIYCSVFLILELFYKAGDHRLFTKFSFLIILQLLFLRSGCALLGLGIVILVKSICYLKYSKKSAGYFVLAIPFFLFAFYYYFSSEIGSALLERTREFSTEGSSGYLRVVQGFFIYDYLPTVNKIFGISTSKLSTMYIPFLSVKSNGDVSMFTNGICTLLIRTGIVGFFLFLNVYIRLYKSTNNMGKASLWLLFALSLVEQVYLLFPMLLCFVIASVKRQTNHKHFLINNQFYNENSISLSNSSV